MKPVGSALRRKLKYTLQNDSPVVEAGVASGINNFLKIVVITVTRKKHFSQGSR
jgi:hypothetical protein